MEPVKASRVCLEHGCPNTANASRYCPLHAKPRGEYGGRGGTSPAWRKARSRAMRRDGKQCTHHDADGVRCPRPATSVHHHVPVIEGGTDDLTNLRSMCKHHHDEADGEARRARMAPHG